MAFELLTILITANQQDTLGGTRKVNRLGPSKFRKEGLNGGELRSADEQGEAAGGCDQRGGDREHRGEALDGTQGHELSALGEVLGPATEDLDVAQIEGAHDFVEEGGFLVVRLDQDQAQAWGMDLEGQAREAGAGAEVDDVKRSFPTLLRQERARPGWAIQENPGGGERLAEVSCNDMFRFAHRGQVDAGVPAQQQVEVGGDLSELRAGKAGRIGLEQGSDAGGIHGSI